MEAFLKNIQDFFTNRFDAGRFAVIALIVLAALIGLVLIARLCFGKKSTFSIAVMSAITIVCIYILTVILTSTTTVLSFLATPLPFIRISGDQLIFFNLSKAGFSTVCSEFLSLMFLAFMVNMIERWMPRGKKMFSWYGFRFLSVALAVAVNYLLVVVIGGMLPVDFTLVSSTVVVIVLVVALLLGAMKIAIGGILTFFNPIFALLYTFFFSNLVGKMLTRAILTSGLLTAGVWALTYFGVLSVCIAPAALVAYIPFLLVMLIMWYLLSRRK